jgi:hypothetical protein
MEKSRISQQSKRMNSLEALKMKREQKRNLKTGVELSGYQLSEYVNTRSVLKSCRNGKVN